MKRLLIGLLLAAAALSACGDQYANQPVPAIQCPSDPTLAQGCTATPQQGVNAPPMSYQEIQYHLGARDMAQDVLVAMMVQYSAYSGCWHCFDPYWNDPFWHGYYGSYYGYYGRPPSYISQHNYTVIQHNTTVIHQAQAKEPAADKLAASAKVAAAPPQSKSASAPQSKSASAPQSKTQPAAAPAPKAQSAPTTAGSSGSNASRGSSFSSSGTSKSSGSFGSSSSFSSGSRSSGSSFSSSRSR